MLCDSFPHQLYCVRVVAARGGVDCGGIWEGGREAPAYGLALPLCGPLNSDFRTRSVLWFINVEIASDNIDLTTPNAWYLI